MTTGLDVIDSAVKIGLGAAIAGLSAALVTWRTHAHDRRKIETETRKRLALDLALAIEKVEVALNETANHFQGGEIALARASLIPATREAYMARALGNLLESDDLVAAIDRMAQIIETVHSEVSRTPPNVNALDRLSFELSEAKKDAYPHVRNSYRRDA